MLGEVDSIREVSPCAPLDFCRDFVGLGAFRPLLDERTLDHTLVDVLHGKQWSDIIQCRRTEMRHRKVKIPADKKISDITVDKGFV